MEKKKPLYLPSELLTEILVRLPVKSLVCFKCVCKLWLTLISDPNFENSHFHLTATNTSRILSISSLSLKIQSIDCESLFDHEYTSPTLNLPSSFPLKIKGSCRGFLFLCHYSKFYLWNPSTGFHRQIPTSHFHSKLIVEAYCLYGFGYDRSRDDYLLVLFCSNIESYLLSHLEFFPLRDNTWKEIESTHFAHISSYYNPKPGTLFKGAIYWLGFSLDLMGNVIVVFDLVERQLLEVNLPDNLEHSRVYCNLWVFEEFLSIWTSSDVNNTLEIWVMKEHSCWTKTLVFVINDVGIPSFPICSTKSGDIIGTNYGYGYGLVRWNDKGKMLEYRFFDNINPHRFEIAMYTESLLSLPCDCEQI